MTWEDAWREGRTGWDAGQPSPTLAELVATERLSPVARTLVPGCGAGYDAVALAPLSTTTIGLDVAPTAAERFAAVRQAAGLSADAVRIVTDDFFGWRPDAPFDRVWDYTFLCAIPLDARPQWAMRMAELVRPGGELWTLIFPQTWVRDDRTLPPFRLMPDEVRALTAEHFDEILLEPVPPERSHPGREGLESIACWRRRA